MITRSKKRMMSSPVEELSQSPDINNQLGIEMSGESGNEIHEVETVSATEVTPSTQQEDYSMGTRGHAEKVQTTKIDMLVELMLKKFEEQTQRMDKMSEEQKQRSEQLEKTIKQQFEEHQRAAEERIKNYVTDKIDEIRTENQQNLQSIENIVQEKEKVLLDKLESCTKRSEQELKTITKKLDKQVKEAGEELKATVRAAHEVHNVKFKEIEDRIQRVDTSMQSTTEKIDAVSVEKERRLEEVCQKITSISEHQDRLQRRLENAETRPLARGECPDISKEVYYDGEDPFPMEFLKELTAIREIYYPDDNTRWIGKHLTGSAATWWRIVKTQVTNYGQFKEAFIDKFWSASHQQKTRDYLEYGRYNPNGSLTMVEYMEHHLLRSRQLIPCLDDRYLIKKLGRHFTREIQIAIVTRGIDTISSFEALLREYMEIKPHNTSDSYNHDKSKHVNKGGQPHVKRENNNERVSNKYQEGKWGGKRPDRNESERQVVNTITIEPTPSQPSTSKRDFSSKNGVTNKDC